MKKLWSVVIVFLLAFSSVISTYAINDTKKEVRVGIFSLGHFQYMENGEAKGYNIDFLEKIGEKNHWTFKYVECQNWVEATKLLEEKKIDLLAPAQITEDLSKRFLYTNYSMGVEFGAIYCLENRDDLIYEDYGNMNNMVFGGVGLSSFTDHFRDYAKEHDFNPNIKTYNNTTELFDALKKKEVDAIVTNIMFATENVKTLGRFNPTPVYYISYIGNNAFVNEVNDALYDIQLNDPTFQADLTNTHFPQYTNTQFTYNEYQFIKSLPKIQIGYVPNTKPISYTNNNTFKGITKHLLDRISEISGVEFEYIALPTGEVSYDYLKENKIFVVSNVEYNHFNTSNAYMSVSHPYMTSEVVIVGKQVSHFSLSDELTLALPTGSGTLPKVIKEEYPNFKVDVYATTEECFDAVENGEADILLQNRHIVTPFLSKPQYTNLSVMPIQTVNNKFSLAVMMYPDVNDDTLELLKNDMFISIMNKSIDQLTQDEINTFTIEETALNTYKTTFTDFLYEYRVSLICVFILIVIIIVLVLKSRKVEEKKNEELEAKNNELKDAVEQAHIASKAKSQFLSRMSHEIRTPMNAIVGLTAIAKNHLGEDEKIDDYLNKIDSSSKILLNIINDVLDMSAIESEKLKIGHSQFNLKELLVSISNVYYTQCKNKGITYEMITGEISHDIVIGDSLRVNQIILNLVSNAYKFTDSGGKITIEVKEKTIKGDTEYVEIKVKDTGCGMSKDMLSRLFQSFEQESAATAKNHGGSGLGLSIAKNLVDLMNGAINVESEKGKGTIFTVDLPFEIPKEIKQIDPNRIKDMKVLIVDDDEYALEHISIVLDRLHVHYDKASSGEDAIKLISKAVDSGSKYDLCFIDWKMPGMSGVEMTREVRDVYSKDMIIIIVSAYDLSEVEDEARSAGANLFVAKPIFQSTIFNTLLSVTGKSLVEDNVDNSHFDFGGKKVLLAEDNEMNTEIAIELLELVNMKVDHAANGQEAVDMFNASKSGEYEMILMDIQMPVMDGFTATRTIRKLEREDAKTISIYAMSADAFNEDVSESMNSGMNGHIAKPIDTNILYRTIQKVINTKD